MDQNIFRFMFKNIEYTWLPVLDPGLVRDGSLGAPAFLKLAYWWAYVAKIITVHNLYKLMSSPAFLGERSPGKKSYLFPFLLSSTSQCFASFLHTLNTVLVTKMGPFQLSLQQIHSWWNTIAMHGKFTSIISPWCGKSIYSVNSLLEADLSNLCCDLKDNYIAKVNFTAFIITYMTYKSMYQLPLM